MDHSVGWKRDKKQWVQPSSPLNSLNGVPFVLRRGSSFSSGRLMLICGVLDDFVQLSDKHFQSPPAKAPRRKPSLGQNQLDLLKVNFLIFAIYSITSALK